jgi:hypothetical protein
MRQVVLRTGPVGTSLAFMLTSAGTDVQLLSVMDNRAYDMPGTNPAHVEAAVSTALVEACEGAEVRIGIWGSDHAASDRDASNAGLVQAQL